LTPLRILAGVLFTLIACTSEPRVDEARLRLELPEGFAHRTDSAMFPEEVPPGEVRFVRAAHPSGVEIDATFALSVPLEDSDLPAFTDHFTANAARLMPTLQIDGSKLIVENGVRMLVVAYRTRSDRYVGMMIFRACAGHMVRVFLQAPSIVPSEAIVPMGEALLRNVAAVRPEAP
jgi:hypothetical protein